MKQRVLVPSLPCGGRTGWGVLIKMTSTAQKLRTRLTDAEQKLWQHIRSRQLMGFKFRRQAPIGKYIVDFVCFEQQLVVELDGGQHAVNLDYDRLRSEWLESQGFKVIRFWNHDVMSNIVGVKEVIALNLTTPHPDLPPQGGKEK
jgi:very-short-patch-repair endonuclease